MCVVCVGYVTVCDMCASGAWYVCICGWGVYVVCECECEWRVVCTRVVSAVIVVRVVCVVWVWLYVWGMCVGVKEAFGPSPNPNAHQVLFFVRVNIG